MAKQLKDPVSEQSPTEKKDDFAASVDKTLSTFDGSSLEIAKQGALRNPEFAMFSTAGAYIQFGTDGKITTRKREDSLDEPHRRAGRDPIITLEYTLPLTIGPLQGWIAPFGMIIVSGGSGVGKSDFIRQLGKLMAVDRVLSVEPPDGQDELENLPIRFSSDAALAYLVGNVLSGSKALPVLDSLREPLFEITGSAADKGIINAFFTRVTRVSNSLAMNGITMLATVNPLSRDEEFMRAFIPRLVSSTPAYILLESRDETSTATTFRGKIAQRPERKERQFTMTVPKNGATPVADAEAVQFTIKDVGELRPLTVSERALIDTIGKTV